MFSALRKLFTPAARREKFVVLAFRFPDGVSSDAAASIRGALNALDCDGWWFLNPGTFQVFFLAAKSGSSRATLCREAIAILSNGTPKLSGIQFGSGEGDLIARFNEKGHLSAPPLGGAVNDAMRYGG